MSTITGSKDAAGLSFGRDGKTCERCRFEIHLKEFIELNLEKNNLINFEMRL